ncbi:hypothetical protein LguiA_019227 [Lonicera macranthoides]
MLHPSNLQVITFLESETIRGNMAQTRDNNRRRKLGKQASRPWGTLPEDLLILIIMHLEFPDFLSFGRVCRSWRSAAEAQRKIFLAPKPPFVGVISSFAKKSISFKNIFEETRYKTMLRDVNSKLCLGSSCGYLMMLESDYRLWLVHPITGNEFRFPSLPGSSRKEISSQCRAVLVYSPTLSGYQVVAIYRNTKQIMNGGPHDADWRCLTFHFLPCEFADLAFFKGAIYVLATNCLIYQVSVQRCGIIFFPMEVKYAPSVSGLNLQLVSSNERLFMVDCYSELRLPFVYEVDFDSMTWVRMLDLGDEAIFLSDLKSSFVANPTKWGAQGNCVYVLQKKDHLCCIYSLDGREIGGVRVLYGERPTTKLPFIWYLPELSYSRDDI